MILPPVDVATESLAQHRARFGDLPLAFELIRHLRVADLRGRGGAGFPAWIKWEAVATRAYGRAVVVANGAEGEPSSVKDTALMTRTPHLVIDGVVLAMRTVGARSAYVYASNSAALTAVTAALRTRTDEEARAIRVVVAPYGYVAGEETAAVAYINSGVALPTGTAVRPFDRGVGGRPTLVQNVDTLAQAALIARWGGEWYRALGLAGAAGIALISVAPADGLPRCVEVRQGTPLGALAGLGGVEINDADAVLVGGYFGTWARFGNVKHVAVSSDALQAAGLRLGAGVVAHAPVTSCGIARTAAILDDLATASARQCGPCVFGLGAVAAAWSRIARSAAEVTDLSDVRRWSLNLTGRGACHHPDAAAGIVASALTTFASDAAAHAHGERCRAQAPTSAAVVRVA